MNLGEVGFWAENGVIYVSCFVVITYRAEKLSKIVRFWSKVDCFWSVFDRFWTGNERFLTVFDG